MNISQSYPNKMIGLGFFDMVKAVFSAEDRDYTSVTKTFHSVDLVGWVHGGWWVGT